MEKKVYRGIRDKNGGVKVTVNNLPLLPGENTRFDWGKEERLSVDLAYAILLDHFEGDEVRAIRYCRRFNRRTFANILTDIWVINSFAMEQWITEIEREMGDDRAEFAIKNSMNKN